MKYRAHIHRERIDTWKYTVYDAEGIEVRAVGGLTSHEFASGHSEATIRMLEEREELQAQHQALKERARTDCTKAIQHIHNVQAGHKALVLSYVNLLEQAVAKITDRGPRNAGFIDSINAHAQETRKVLTEEAPKVMH